MGTDYNVYVGPYIKVTDTKVNVLKSYAGCVNETCSEHKKENKAPYCPMCGNMTNRVEFIAKQKSDFDIYEVGNDRLCEAFNGTFPDGMENCMFFIPNKKGYGKNMDVKYDREEHQIKSIVGDTNKFITDHQDLITKIERTFGSDGVYIEFGVLTWTS